MVVPTNQVPGPSAGLLDSGHTTVRLLFAGVSAYKICEQLRQLTLGLYYTTTAH